MTVRDTLKEIEHLEGLIGVWSHLREKLDSDLVSDQGIVLVSLSGVRSGHIDEVADELDTTLTELQEALDEVLDRDTK